MNWNEIEKKFPKAFKLLDQKFDCSKMGDIYGPRYPRVRDLYDLFDEHALQISIGPPIGDSFTLCFWDYDIVMPQADQTPYYMEGDYGFKSRVETEEAAFTRAFELLNKRLK
jgi:hypothetical protein